MTNLKLQLLIPQYKETDDVIKPMLDSVAIQQGIDLSEVGVVIVNDGTDVKLSQKFLDSYPFKIEYYQAERIRWYTISRINYLGTRLLS